MQSITEAFRAACKAYPDNIAVEGETVSWTYARLDAISDSIANGLAEHGVGLGDFVPVSLGRSPWYIAAVLAVIKRGAAYAPIEPEHPESRKSSILDDLDAKVGIGWANAKLGKSTLTRMLAVEELGTFPPDASLIEPGPNDPINVIFTSGSTGRPKGVIVPHRGIVRLVNNANYCDYGPWQRWGVFASVGFDISTQEIWGALANGGACIVLEDARPTIERMAEVIVSRQTSDLHITATILNLLIDHSPRVFRGVRQIITGAEPESVRHMRTLITQVPTVRLIHGYGPTENSVLSHGHTVTHADVARDVRVPVGRPIRGTIQRILLESGAEAGVDEVGEIVLGGPGVAVGYLKRAELTKQRFVSFADAKGLWYRSGDLGKVRADGLTEIVGRADRQVKLRGFRIELEEVERALATCPGVTGASVDIAGETPERRRLVAWYSIEAALDAKQSFSEDARIRTWLERTLPGYMVPDELHNLRSLPRTTNGKVDRKALRATLDQSAVHPDQAAVHVIDPAISWLAEIWRVLLARTDLEADTDFFRAGGHSVLVLKMISEIRLAKGVQIEPSAVYRERTLRNIAILATAASTVLTDRPATTSDACGIMERGLVFEHGLRPDSSAYNVCAVFHTGADFDPSAFESAFKDVIARHAALRTGYRLGPSGPARVLLANRTPVHMHAPVAAVSRSAPLPEPVLRAVRRPFDLSRGGLAVAHLFPISGGGWIVAMVFQHAIVDEWSIDLILDELGDRARARDPAPGIEEYVAWESGAADRRRARDLGVSLLDDCRKGYPIMAKGGGLAVEVSRRLDEHLSRRISEYSLEHGTTPFVIAMAAYCTVLREFTGGHDPWLATPFANRREPSLREVVGCGIDMRLLRPLSSNARTFRDAVSEVHAAVMREQDAGPTPLEEAAAVLRRSGLGFDAAVQFALTYRVDPMRRRRLGGVRADALRVPAETAKFGLLVQFEQSADGLECIVEADARVFGAPRLEQFIDDMIQVLRDGLGCLPPFNSRNEAISDTGVSIDGTAHEVDEERLARQGESNLSEACRDAWQEVLGNAPATSEADFFESGGTSLLALRLAAIVQQITGRSLDLTKFIEQPTFDAMCSHLKANTNSTLVASFGDPESDLTIIGLPGLSAPSVSYYTLWRALQTCTRMPIRFLSVDFSRMMQPLLNGASVEAVVGEVVQVVEPSVRGRRFGIMAYSLGGVMGTDIADRLSGLGQEPAHLWLLDAYPPELVWPSISTRLLTGTRLLATEPTSTSRRILKSVRRRLAPNAASPAPTPSAEVVDKARQLLDTVDFKRAFLAYRARPFKGPATLLKSTHECRLLGRRDPEWRCGMDRLLAGPIRVEQIDIEHLEILRSGAGTIAASLADEVARVARGQPFNPPVDNRST